MAEADDTIGGPTPEAGNDVGPLDSYPETDGEVLGFEPNDIPPDLSKEKPSDRPASDTPAPSEPLPAAAKAADDQSIAAQPATAQGEKFSFYGREFDSREAAENYFRTWNGQLSSASAKINELNEALARQNDMIERLQAKAPESAREAPPAKQELPKKIADAIDWGVYKALAEEKGHDVAQEWLMLKTEELLDGRFKSLEEGYEKKLSEKLQGWDQLSGYMQKLNVAGSLFEKLYTRSDAQGNPAYPEMDDPQFLEEMAFYWDQLPDKEQQGLRGAYLAYLETKDRRAREGRGVAKAAPAPRPVTPKQDTTVTGGGVPRVSNNRGHSSAIKNALKAEYEKVDPVLGF